MTREPGIDRIAGASAAFGDRMLDGTRPIASIVKLVVVANLIAVTAAVILPSPAGGHAIAAANTFAGWCGIG
jgi:hypothetical protein